MYESSKSMQDDMLEEKAWMKTRDKSEIQTDANKWSWWIECQLHHHTAGFQNYNPTSSHIQTLSRVRYQITTAVTE